MAADSPDPNIPKKTTVRITLPPKPGVASPTGLGGSGEVKKETVRIGAPPPPPAPAAPPVPPSFPRPAGAVPPPPAPVAPKAPAAPGVPPRPIAPPPPAANAPAAPVPVAPVLPVMPAPRKPQTARITSSIGPKKETTRISLPPDPKAMPKATVKLNQTAPLATPPPPAAFRTSKIAASAEAAEPETQANQEKDDPFMLPLSLLAFIAALIVAVLAFCPGLI